MKTTQYYNLKKPEGADVVNIEEVNSNMDIVDGELKSISNRLDGLHNYTHPETHPATMITQDATRRFVSDTEKTSWNGKLDKTGDGSNLTAVYTQATSRANLTTREKLSVSLGKIMKWFADLQAIAFSGSVSDLAGTLPITKGGTGATTAAAARTALGAVPLAGGTMTGQLGFKIGSRTDIPCKIIAGDANGNALLMQAGGLTIMGGGEAAYGLYDALATEGVAAAAERAYVASDGAAYIVTNCQTIANRKTVTIDTTGKITAPNGFSGALNPNDLSAAVPLVKGGTGATSAAAARTALGAAAASHTHAASQVTAGNLPVGVKATNSTDYTTSRVRNIRFGTAAPSSLANGEIFIVYE